MSHEPFDTSPAAEKARQRRADSSFEGLMTRDRQLVRRRNSIVATQVLALGSAIAYPTILAFTDQILPSGNFTTDVVKYGLELFLGGLATGTIAVANRQRKLFKSVRHDRNANDNQIETWHDQWGA